MGARLFPGTSSKELLGAYGVIRDANDRYKEKADEAATQTYMQQMLNGQEVDTNSPDFNAMAHHKASVAISEQQQNSEQIKQQRMATMQQRIQTNHAQFQEIFRMANMARSNGDEEGAKDMLMASYNDLLPNGYKLGRKGGKIVSYGPDGSVRDSDVTPDEMWKMAQQYVDPKVYAESFIGEYSRNKANNQAVLSDPERAYNKDGEIAIKLKGLLQKETGEPVPTIYIYRGKTYDENWAIENGFADAETSKKENELVKGGAEADMKKKDAKYYDEDRKKDIELKDSQIFANYNQDARQAAAADLSNANKVTPLKDLNGQTVNVSNTQYKAYEDKAAAASQNWALGIKKVNPQHMFTFEQMTQRSPEFKNLLRKLPDEKDKKKRAEMEQVAKALLVKANLDVLAENINRVYELID